MATLQFDDEHADRFGLEEAVMLQHFRYLCEWARSNAEHALSGHTWIYMGLGALLEKYPFLKNARKVQRVLDSLISQAVLIRADAQQRRQLNTQCHRSAWDQTNWFTFADERAFLRARAGVLDQPEMASSKTPGTIDEPEMAPSMDRQRVVDEPETAPSSKESLESHDVLVEKQQQAIPVLSTAPSARLTAAPRTPPPPAPNTTEPDDSAGEWWNTPPPPDMTNPFDDDPEPEPVAKPAPVTARPPAPAKPAPVEAKPQPAPKPAAAAPEEEDPAYLALRDFYGSETEARGLLRETGPLEADYVRGWIAEVRRRENVRRPGGLLRRMLLDRAPLPEPVKAKEPERTGRTILIYDEPPPQDCPFSELRLRYDHRTVPCDPPPGKENDGNRYIALRWLPLPPKPVIIRTQEEKDAGIIRALDQSDPKGRALILNTLPYCRHLRDTYKPPEERAALAAAAAGVAS